MKLSLYVRKWNCALLISQQGKVGASHTGPHVLISTYKGRSREHVEGSLQAEHGLVVASLSSVCYGISWQDFECLNACVTARGQMLIVTDKASPPHDHRRGQTSRACLWQFPSRTWAHCEGCFCPQSCTDYWMSSACAAALPFLTLSMQTPGATPAPSIFTA